MSATALERVFRHDRVVVLSTIAAVAGLCWLYLLWLAAAGMEMPGGDVSGMGGMDMSGMAAPSLQPWSVADFGFMFVMWAAMMAGMMLPSAAPMVLLYARVGRQAHERGKPFAATGWFAAGYLLAWAGFSVFATGAQWALEQAALLSPLTMRIGEAAGGLVLVAAGLYQWTPLKDACLAHCRAPLVFIQHHGGFRRDPAGALRVGLRHGLYCIGCCWALMVLLFVGGVMNLFWIAGLALLVLVEKALPAGRVVARVAGIVLVAWGVWVLVG